MSISNNYVASLLMTAMIGLVFSITLLRSSYLAAVCLIGLLIVIWFSSPPITSLTLVIVLMPFTKTRIFDLNLLGFMGTKPVYILFLFILCIMALNYKRSYRLPRYAQIFLSLIGAVFIISVFRSIVNIDIFSHIWKDEFSKVRYILSYGLRPVIYLLPFVFIGKYARDKRDLESIVRALLLSIIGLSVYLLYLYVFKAPDKGYLLSVRTYYESVLNMHGNDLANFYIITIPLMLARFFQKKDLLCVIAIITSLPVIGILCSRTAYFSLFFSTALFCVMTRRIKYVPILLLVISIIFSGIAYKSIQERVLTGIGTNNYNQISAGRIDGIWRPLFYEYIRDSRKAFFGKGRHAILISDSYQSRRVRVEHPHNMYFEQMLDSGLMGILIVLGAFLYILAKIKESLGLISDPRLKEYQCAVYVALITFLISGLVGRSFYPVVHNAYLWILLGMAVSIIRSSKEHGEGSDEKSKSMLCLPRDIFAA